MSNEVDTTVAIACQNHCGHSPDWMRYDEDYEAVRCAHPVGHACEYCGGIECGHVCNLGVEAPEQSPLLQQALKDEAKGL